MILEVRAVHPFFKNGYVVGCEETRDALVIDPGDEVEQLLEAVKTHGLQVRYILLTHAHLDHIAGVGRAKAALGVPVLDGLGVTGDGAHTLYEHILVGDIANRAALLTCLLMEAE